jgi:hypothetical protein
MPDVWACPWHISVQESLPPLYEYVMGVEPFGATTFASKFTNRWPEIVAAVFPMPCAVWQTEHENPVFTCARC